IENKWDDDPARRLKMWAARQGIIASLSKVTRGARMQSIVDDPGIPITKIPEAIKEIQKISEKHDIPISTFGHIGDGNLHPVMMCDPRNKEQWTRMKEVAKDLIELALPFRGTLTAEHGTGMAKSPYIGRELGETLNVMWEIKKALDPYNILNPGKMGFDDSIKDIYENFAFGPLVERPAEMKGFGEALDNEIMACMMCGFCRNGCPTYKEIGLESVNARGRVILAYHLMTGRLEPSKALAERFYQCATCLNCRSVCPAGVQVSEIVEAARRRLVEAGLLPDIHKTLMENLKATGNPFGEPKEKRTDIFPSTFQPPKGPVDTLLFPGCVSSFQDISILPSMMKIMDKAGVVYTALGKEENCCGYISYLVGTEEFKAVAEKNKEAFSKVSPKQVVTTCAGCYKTFKEIYPKHLSFNTPVVHAIEYIDRLIEEGKLKLKDGNPMKVAYHDPCDLGRHLNIFEPPRNLIKKVPGVTLLEFKNNRLLAKCCGGGGGLKAFNNELS
ncbi:MAG: hypothetical protein EHM36_16545, partial [Deltaproteobacteria bacterium]